jgi:hypothetical protein
LGQESRIFAMASCQCVCQEIFGLHCTAPRLYALVNSNRNHAPKTVQPQQGNVANGRLIGPGRGANSAQRVKKWQHLLQYPITNATKYQRVIMSHSVALCSLPCSPTWVLAVLGVDILGVGAPRYAWMPVGTWSVCMPAPEDGLEDGAPLTPASLCRAPTERATCQPTMDATADVITPVTTAHTAHSDLIE